jgi:hypothetical protein
VDADDLVLVSGVARCGLGVAEDGTVTVWFEPEDVGVRGVECESLEG